MNKTSTIRWDAVKKSILPACCVVNDSSISSMTSSWIKGTYLDKKTILRQTEGSFFISPDAVAAGVVFQED